MGLIKSDEIIKTEDSDYNAFEDKENKPINLHEHSIDVFSVEYARSARSKCKKCEKRIGKDEIRFQLHSDGSYHLDCFAKSHDELGFNYDPTKITGFEDLDEVDQNLVVKVLQDNTSHNP